MDGDVGAILLAAGGATRMGMPKQLLVYQGHSLLRHAARTALAATLHPMIVVLGAHAERLRHEVQDLPVESVLNQQWEKGLGTSIQTGVRTLQAVAPDVRAVILMLCDQPLVSPTTLRDLVTAYQATRKSVIASKYENTIGVPALFDREHFSKLEQLTNGQGAKGILAAAGDALHAIPFPDGSFDVDTPLDYLRLTAHLEA